MLRFSAETSADLPVAPADPVAGDSDLHDSEDA